MYYNYFLFVLILINTSVEIFLFSYLYFKPYNIVKLFGVLCHDFKVFSVMDEYVFLEDDPKKTVVTLELSKSLKLRHNASKPFNI